jgi:uncharacterized membrane protein
MIVDRLPIARWLPSCSWPRSLAKTLTWRLFATLDTFLISIFITKNLKASGSIVGVEVVTKLVWYLLHERAWARLPPSREPPVSSVSPTPRPPTPVGAVGIRCLAVHMNAAARPGALKRGR